MGKHLVTIFVVVLCAIHIHTKSVGLLPSDQQENQRIKWDVDGGVSEDFYLPGGQSVGLLPSEQQEIQRIKRDVDVGVSKDLYLPGGQNYSAGVLLSSKGSLKGTLQQQVNLVNTTNHKVYAYAGLENPLGKTKIGLPTAGAGVKYEHSSGVGAFLGISTFPGIPIAPSGGVSVPVGNGTRLGYSFGAGGPGITFDVNN